MRITSGVKSLSEDTIAKALSWLVYSRSIASITIDTSVAFLPLVRSNCCTGRIAYSCSWSAQRFSPGLVQLP